MCIQYHKTFNVILRFFPSYTLVGTSKNFVVTKCNATPVTGKTVLFCFIHFSGLPSLEYSQISHQLHVPFNSREQNANSLKLRNTQPPSPPGNSTMCTDTERKSNSEVSKFKQMFSRHYHNNFIGKKKLSGTDYY